MERSLGKRYKKKAGQQEVSLSQRIEKILQVEESLVAQEKNSQERDGDCQFNQI
jgi:hypothetical protein